MNYNYIQHHRRQTEVTKHFHLYKLKNRQILINGDKNKNSGYFWRVILGRGRNPLMCQKCPLSLKVVVMEEAVQICKIY